MLPESITKLEDFSFQFEYFNNYDYEQIISIMNVMGSPKDSSKNIYRIWPDRIHSKAWENYKDILYNFKGDKFKQLKIFPMLAKCLTYDPKNRCSANELFEDVNFQTTNILNPVVKRKLTTSDLEEIKELETKYKNKYPTEISTPCLLYIIYLYLSTDDYDINLKICDHIMNIYIMDDTESKKQIPIKTFQKFLKSNNFNFIINTPMDLCDSFTDQKYNDDLIKSVCLMYSC